MNDTCQHCGELIVGNAYRVTSEDQGIPLLDMVVCSLCFMEAKRLHLHAEEINLGANKLQLETERIIIRDSAFNFNTGSFIQRLSSVVKAWSAERLIEVPPKVKDERGVVNRYWPTHSPPQNPKSGGA